MRLHVLIVLGFALIILGCAEKEPAAPEEASEMEDATAAGVEALPDEPDAAAAPVEDWRNSAFMDHMHAHAEHLDELNFALDDEDLETAMTPAYWLSRHNTVDGLPEELQPYLIGMREAARAVEAAENLDAARAGAQQIAKQCQACHAAVGVVTE